MIDADDTDDTDDDDDDDALADGEETAAPQSLMR